MKTITLGQFRLRERNNHVYLYLIKGAHEEYIAPLDKIVDQFLDSQVDSKRDSDGKIKELTNDTETTFTKSEGVYESGISERDLQKFIEYCKKLATDRVCNKYSSQLKRPPTNSHSSIRAWRMFYKMKNNPEKMKELKIPRSGSDLRYVTEEEVLNAIKNADEQSKYLLILLLESGARLSEIIKILREYDPSKDVKNSDQYTYYIYTVNWKRGAKNAYYLFHITPLRKLELSYDNTEAKLLHYINPKMIRKFVATKMYEIGISAEVIDFIQGRSPSSIATKHYIYLLVTAKKAYEEKWIPYLHNLFKF